MDEELEYTLLNKKDVMVFHPIPPVSSSSGHKADEWKNCVWRGRLRVCGKGPDLLVKLLNTKDGAENLFAQCVCPNGDHEKNVERVVDSSRYFALKITNGARHEFIGIGFEDRNDAFDFNCTLNDFKGTWVEEQNTPAENVPSRDLSLKAGQQITVNFKGLGTRRREQPANGDNINSGFGGLIAPPPPAGSHSRRQQTGGYSTGSSAAPVPASAPARAVNQDDFGDFDDFQTAAPASVATPTTTVSAPAAAPMKGAEFFLPTPAATFADPAVNAPFAQSSPAPAFSTAATAASTSAPKANAPGLADHLSGLSDQLGGLGLGTPKPAPTPSIGQSIPAHSQMPMAQKAAAPAQPMWSTGQPPAQASAAPAGGPDPFAIFGNGSAPANKAMPGQSFAMPSGAPAGQKPGGRDPFDAFDIFK